MGAIQKHASIIRKTIVKEWQRQEIVKEDCCFSALQAVWIYLHVYSHNFWFIFQALCGTTLQVPTIDGRKIPLRLNEIIKPSTVKRIQGEGLPMPKQSSRRGDLTVEFDIKFPSRMTSSAKEILSDCLPDSWKGQ